MCDEGHEKLLIMDTGTRIPLEDMLEATVVEG
jgi:hypothetical protein